MLPRQGCSDSPITVRALHCCAPHRPSAAQLAVLALVLSFSVSSDDSPLGLGRCSAHGSVSVFSGSSHNSQIRVCGANDPHDLFLGENDGDMLAGSGNFLGRLVARLPPGWRSHCFGSARSSIARPTPHGVERNHSDRCTSRSPLRPSPFPLRT